MENLAFHEMCGEHDEQAPPGSNSKTINGLERTMDAIDPSVDCQHDCG